MERLLDVDHHETVLVLHDLIIDVPGYGVYLGACLFQVILHTSMFPAVLNTAPNLVMVLIRSQFFGFSLANK